MNDNFPDGSEIGTFLRLSQHLIGSDIKSTNNAYSLSTLCTFLCYLCGIIRGCLGAAFAVLRDPKQKPNESISTFCLSPKVIAIIADRVSRPNTHLRKQKQRIFPAC